MKILILGADGYIGWPLSLRLLNMGHYVNGIDNYSRRERVLKVDSNSLIPISDKRWRNKILPIEQGSVRFLNFLADYDCIVHLAEQPSAPYSMRDMGHSLETINQNVMGTMNLLWLIKEYCPNTHLLKLGTLGEFGYPDCPIPEGFIEDGDLKGLPFPKQAGSFYHLSKVFDSCCIEFVNKIWGLRCTDIMQGVVFGSKTSDIDTARKATRFDYDQYFGTVINRFCAQAVCGIPLTIYGTGNQVRGYLPLKDSIECLSLAIHNPPKQGEYRIFNQFAKIISLNELAKRVETIGNELGLNVKTEHIANPRVEIDNPSYNPKQENLKKLGFEPKWALNDEIRELLVELIPYKDRISKKVIQPTVNWR